MKKLIGLGLWLLAFLIPFRFAILDTEQVVLDNGMADNITGLISFVIMLGLIFGGYILVDSASSKPAAQSHGH